MLSVFFRKKSSGQTLVEVTMATVIAAMTATSVFSVVLSGTVSQAKADKRELATYILKRAQETLKSYVSADPYTANYAPTGPGGVGRWVADSSGGWALAAGLHNVTSLCGGVAGCNFTYTVTDYDCGFGKLGTIPGANACKQVQFSLTYPDN